jgi:hypothetical protein
VPGRVEGPAVVFAFVPAFSLAFTPGLVSGHDFSRPETARHFSKDKVRGEAALKSRAFRRPSISAKASKIASKHPVTQSN